jgi:hypothetical protein
MIGRLQENLRRTLADWAKQVAESVQQPIRGQNVTNINAQPLPRFCLKLLKRLPKLNRTMVAAYLPQLEHEDHKCLEPAIPPFAGRLGGHQDFIVDRNDPKNVAVLKEVPDAAPCMSLAEIFDLRGFLSPVLWKFAMLECVGKPHT